MRHEQMVDLSMGGMFVSTFLPLEVGEVVDFETQIATMRFTGAGRVLWVRSRVAGDGQPAGAAIEFLNLTPGQKRLLHLEIADYVKSGGELMVGSPQSGGAAGREGETATAARGGLLRRFRAMIRT